MSDYKGIKIPDKIIIVENMHKQGYVVLPESKSSLESAINWGTQRLYTWDSTQRCIDNGTFDAIVNEYENGHFKVKLYESAGYSSQGGKLSFWNCTIVAPDNKEYIIGINSELLLKLLKNTTVVNGEVQGTVWLGKEKTNTGIYLPHMDDFKQARVEDVIRATKQTSGYKPGDIVKTLNSTEIYLGTMWQYIDTDEDSYCYKDIIIYKEPRKVHVFVALRIDDDGTIKPWWTDIKASKPKRMICNDIKYTLDLKEHMEHFRKITEVDSTMSPDELYRVNRNNQENKLHRMQYTIEKSGVDVEEAYKLISKMFTYNLRDIDVQEHW